MATSLKHTVMASLTWLATARLIAQLLRWGASLVLANKLSPIDYSIVMQAEVVLGFIELFTSLGLGGAIIRSKTITHAELRAIFGVVLFINGFLALCLFGAASVVSAAYDRPELLLVMRVQAATFLFSSIGMLPQAFLMKAMRYKGMAFTQVLSGVVGATTSLVLAYQGVGYWAIVLGGISMQISRVVAMSIMEPVFVFPSAKFRIALEHIKVGGIFLFANVVWYLYVSMDLYIAGAFWDVTTLGLYAFALQVASMPLNKMMPVLKQVALPAYSKARDDETLGRQYLVKSLRLAMGLGFPIFVGLASISPLLVTVALGDQWIDAIPAMTLLFMVMPFRMFLELHQPAVAISHKPKLILTNAITILVILAPAFFLASQFNPTVLAATWLGLFSVLALRASHVFCKVLGIDFREILRHLLYTLLTSLAMFALVRATIYFLTGTVPEWANLALATAVGAAFYLSTIYLTDKRMFGEYISLFKR